MKITKIALLVYFLIIILMNNVFCQSFDKTASFNLLLKRGFTENKPILLMFGSESCKPCEMLKNALLKDTTLMRKLSDKYILREVESKIKVKDDNKRYEKNENGSIAKRFKITGLPVIIILESTSDSKYIVKQKIVGISLKQYESTLTNPAVIMKDYETVDVESTMKYIPL